MHCSAKTKCIIDVDVNDLDGNTESINTFAQQLPFKCKYCGDNIYYCYLTTYDDDDKNNKWLNTSTLISSTDPKGESVNDYCGERHPLACISEKCKPYGKNAQLVFYIEDMIDINIGICDTIFI